MDGGYVKKQNKVFFYHEGHEAHEEKICFDKPINSICGNPCSSVSCHRIFTMKNNQFIEFIAFIEFIGLKPWLVRCGLQVVLHTTHNLLP